jgi:hypothetical protein
MKEKRVQKNLFLSLVKVGKLKQVLLIERLSAYVSQMHTEHRFEKLIRGEIYSELFRGEEVIKQRMGC